jgi:hypothetical protein
MLLQQIFKLTRMRLGGIVVFAFVAIVFDNRDDAGEFF